MSDELEVIVVGGGFAGVGCAGRLARHDDVHVTLLDRNNYHQFQPLLYQVATSQLASSDIAFSLRKALRATHANVDVKLGTVESLDPVARTVTTTDGRTFTGDAIVLAAGLAAELLPHRGRREHAFPLYCLDDAQRLRSRIIGVFEDADRDPALIDQGALNFVVIGGGPTGVEFAGALADLIHEHDDRASSTISRSRTRGSTSSTSGTRLLGPFSDRAHDYVAKVLARKGVRCTSAAR